MYVNESVCLHMCGSVCLHVCVYVYICVRSEERRVGKECRL